MPTPSSGPPSPAAHHEHFFDAGALDLTVANDAVTVVPMTLFAGAIWAVALDRRARA